MYRTDDDNDDDGDDNEQENGFEIPYYMNLVLIATWFLAYISFICFIIITIINKLLLFSFKKSESEQREEVVWKPDTQHPRSGTHGHNRNNRLGSG